MFRFLTRLFSNETKPEVVPAPQVLSQEEQELNFLIGLFAKHPTQKIHQWTGLGYIFEFNICPEGSDIRIELSYYSIRKKWKMNIWSRSELSKPSQLLFFDANRRSINFVREAASIQPLLDVRLEERAKQKQEEEAQTQAIINKYTE